MPGYAGGCAAVPSPRPGWIPEEWQPGKRRLPNGRVASEGCSCAEERGGRTEPGEGDPRAGVTARAGGLTGEEAPEMLEPRKPRLEGRGRVNASPSQLAMGVTGLSLFGQGSCK